MHDAAVPAAQVIQSRAGSSKAPPGGLWKPPALPYVAGMGQDTPDDTSATAGGQTALRSYFDHADWHFMRGWAFDPLTPDRPVWLEVVIDDAAPVAFLANLYREDLERLGLGDGRRGFDLRFPQPLDPRVAHRILVRRRSDGAAIDNSPIHLARAPAISAVARAAFEAQIAAQIDAEIEAQIEVGTPGHDQTLTFLLRQAERLLLGRTETLSGVARLQRFRLRWSDYLDGERALPLQPDLRPWALLVDAELPDTAEPLALVAALQHLGYRVAVSAARGLASTGAVARSLAAMGVMAIGGPEHFTVEDVLRRSRGQFRVVLLRGPSVAAGYGLLARLHQPRARVIACLGDLPQDRADIALTIAACLLADATLTETEAAAAALRAQLPGRSFLAIATQADAATVAAHTAAVAAGLVASGVVSHRPPA